jgi:TPR repeat protein
MVAYVVRVWSLAAIVLALRSTSTTPSTPEASMPQADVDHACRRAPARCVEFCERGNAWACAVSSNFYLYARGVGKDIARADVLARRGCHLGHLSACASLGYILENGLTGPPDKRSAIVLYSRACDADVGLACNNLGAAIVRDEPTRARELFDKACASSSPEAKRHGCFNIANVTLRNDDDPAARFLALCQLHRAARAGSGLAFWALARHTDDANRRRYLRREACSLAVESACRELTDEERPTIPPGTHHCEPPNWADCSAQCDAGHLGSCRVLGEMTSRDPNRNVERATELLEHACEGGDVVACTSLGRLLVDTHRIEDTDPVVRMFAGLRATGLFRAACNDGEGIGCALSGDDEKACERGVDVSCVALAKAAPTPQRRGELLRCACTLGNEEACLQL